MFIFKKRTEFYEIRTQKYDLAKTNKHVLIYSQYNNSGNFKFREKFIKRVYLSEAELISRYI